MITQRKEHRCSVRPGFPCTSTYVGLMLNLTGARAPSRTTNTRSWRKMNTPLESCWKAFQIYCRGKQRERCFCWKKMSRVSWKIEKSVMQACRSFAATIFEIFVTRDFFYVRLYRVCRVVAKSTKHVAFRAENQNCRRIRYIVLNFESCSFFFSQATLETRQTHKNQIYLKLFIH